ncbi:hypothetical protein GG344DRAFT_62898 [Lentinula edodes]|nr:hypothetical protein GG344DRAFT_62898 [Lentinula edodes]
MTLSSALVSKFLVIFTLLLLSITVVTAKPITIGQRVMRVSVIYTEGTVSIPETSEEHTQLETADAAVAKLCTLLVGLLDQRGGVNKVAIGNSAGSVTQGGDSQKFKITVDSSSERTYTGEVSWTGSGNEMVGSHYGGGAEANEGMAYPDEVTLREILRMNRHHLRIGENATQSSVTVTSTDLPWTMRDKFRNSTPSYPLVKSKMAILMKESAKSNQPICSPSKKSGGSGDTPVQAVVTAGAAESSNVLVEFGEDATCS